MSLVRATTSRVGPSVVLMAMAAIAAVTQTQLFVVGMIVGSVLALGAIGLTITYGVLKFPNMAHGLTMMLAAYLTLFFLTGQLRQSALVVGDVVFPLNVSRLPGSLDPFGGLSIGYGFFVATLIAVLATILILLTIDRILYRRLRRKGRDNLMMLMTMSFGLSYILLGIIDTIWGVLPRNLTTGIQLARQYPFGIYLKDDQLFIFASAVITAMAAYFVVYRTRLGKSMRAMSDNIDLARASGISYESVVRSTWILVGIVTGIAGTLLALQAQLNPQLGLQLLLPLFAAAAVGGIGNPVGALVGGFTVGIAQEVAVAFLPSGYKIGIAFVVLAIVLTFKPTGLFATPQA